MWAHLQHIDTKSICKCAINRIEFVAQFYLLILELLALFAFIYSKWKFEAHEKKSAQKRKKSKIAYCKSYR